MKKAHLLGILATALIGQTEPMPVYRKRRPLQGNQGWGRYHEPKVRRWLAKERRAKTARKINWA